MPRPFRTGDGSQGDLRTCCVFLKPRHFSAGTTPPLPIFKQPPRRLSWVHITNSNCWIISIRSNSIHSLSSFPHCIISNGFLVDHNEMAFYCVFILHSHYLSSYSFFQENMQFANIKNMHVWVCASSFAVLMKRTITVRTPESFSLCLAALMRTFVQGLWYQHTFKWILCALKCAHNLAELERN